MQTTKEQKPSAISPTAAVQQANDLVPGRNILCTTCSQWCVSIQTPCVSSIWCTCTKMTWVRWTQLAVNGVWEILKKSKNVPLKNWNWITVAQPLHGPLDRYIQLQRTEMMAGPEISALHKQAAVWIFFSAISHSMQPAFVHPHAILFPNCRIQCHVFCGVTFRSFMSSPIIPMTPPLEVNTQRIIPAG